MLQLVLTHLMARIERAAGQSPTHPPSPFVLISNFKVSLMMMATNTEASNDSTSVALVAQFQRPWHVRGLSIGNKT
jgi:hypothetical protein